MENERKSSRKPKSSSSNKPPAQNPQHSSSSMPPPSPAGPSSLQQSRGKIAIPRLRREGDAHSGAAGSSVVDKSRVTHACEQCRLRKTKCSGDRPICRHCRDFKLLCVYGEGKRDRAKKQHEDMVDRLDEYERLLKELSLEADAATQRRISLALEKDILSEPDADSVSSPHESTSQRSGPVDESDLRFGEHQVSARVGSTESLDKVKEDYDRDEMTRATGYHGKNSDISWLQRLKNTTEVSDDELPENASGQRDPTGSRDSPSRQIPSTNFPLSSLSYHCDDLSVLLPDLHVDSYDRPSKPVADVLLQNFFGTLHSTFPILCETRFTQQYQSFYNNQTNASDSWLAILNAIFAIGARQAQLTRVHWNSGENDHLVFFTRARQLGLNSNSLLQHADLQHIQVCGLLAFYLMSCNQLNRSWAVSGLAIRRASALGLNLQNNSPDMQPFPKEMRYRAWWALCGLEQQLSAMTGRRTAFLGSDCSLPLPMPVEEIEIIDNLSLQGRPSPRPRPVESSISSHSSAQSLRAALATSTPASHSAVSKRKRSQALTQTIPNQGLYFTLATQLNLLSNDILDRLYSAAASEKTWAQTQATMDSLDDELEQWRQKLPSAFDFRSSSIDQRWTLQRNSLGFSFYSIKTIVNRPCLCRLERKIFNESDKAKEIDKLTAARCVRAALGMLDLLPDYFVNTMILTKLPWWCLVHYLVEAAVVCMLDLSFRVDHMPDQVDEVFQGASKALYWLRSMPSQDIAAHRAAYLCDGMLRKVAGKVSRSVNIPPVQSLFSTSEPAEGPYQQHPVASSMFPYQTSESFQPSTLASYDQWSERIHQDVSQGAAIDEGLTGYFPMDPAMGNLDYTAPQGHGFLDPNEPDNPH